MKLLERIDAALARVHGVVLEAYCRRTGKPGNSLARRVCWITFFGGSIAAGVGCGRILIEGVKTESGAKGSVLFLVSIAASVVSYRLMTCLNDAERSVEGVRTVGDTNLRSWQRVALELTSCLFLLWTILQPGYLMMAQGLIGSILLSGAVAASYFIDEPSGGHPFRKAIQWITLHWGRQPHPMPT